jgi:5,10-methylene-tetrahydrofolate dehydrogenase/methenyl tetrahydrofolate cyclohydrolase
MTIAMLLQNTLQAMKQMAPVEVAGR